jgi:rare lipoprotein A
MQRALPLALLAAAALLAGCASGPAPRGTTGASGAGRDGPPLQPPPAQALERVPDAAPRIEPVRPGGPNKPYEVLGRRYVPLDGDPPYTQRGPASWYGRQFHGKPTASGELYDMYGMTAAHPTLPIPSYLRVRNPANGREVIVRVNDRGPFHSDRILDLSYTAALKLDLLRGVRVVEIERITYDDIRTGAWLRGSDATRLAQQEPAPAALPVLAAPERAVDVPRSATAPTAPTASTTSTAPSVPSVPVPPAPPAAPAPPAPPAPPPLDAPAAPAAAQPTASPAVAVADAAPTAASTLSVPTTAVVAVADAAATTPPPAEPLKVEPARSAGAPGFWLQLGAFRQRNGALAEQRRMAAELDWLAPLLAVFDERALHRLQAGPYRTRADATAAAARLRGLLAQPPVIVERR